jgi:PAS domain S-box-containing protein
MAAPSRPSEAEAAAAAFDCSLPAMAHSIDAEGRILEVTDMWLDRLQYRREEVIGRPSTDFLTLESAGRARETMLPRFFEEGRCERVPYQLVRKDGTLLDVLLSAVLKPAKDGQPPRSLAVLQEVSDRNAASALVTETTQLLSLVLDSLPARVSYWGSDSLNRFANQAFLRWYGVEQSAITGRHARLVLGDAAFARIEAFIVRGLAGESGQLEVTAAAPDGSLLVTDMRFIPDALDGRVRGLFVFALDISVQRQTERELAERERRFKVLVEGIREYAVYILDCQGRVASWNDGARRLMGYSEAEVLGRSVDLFQTTDDVQQGRTERALTEAGRSGRFESEGWQVRADGTRFWASALFSAVRDHAGRLVAIAAVVRDLSEQRRQQILLTRVVESAPCAMLLVDAAGAVTMVNAQAETTFGYERMQLLGQSVEMLLPGAGRDAHAQLRRGFLASPSVRSMGAGRPLRALHRDGREIPVEVGLSPIETADGVSTLAAVFDMTERRRQQAATEKALAEKETLLKEVYHRVKNNLQVVQSLLNLQLRGLTSGPAHEAIRDSAQRVRAMALVHEMLYQSGNLAAVSLREYTRVLIEQLVDAIGSDRARVRVEQRIDDIQTGLDAAVPFGLLLTELLSNSFKHAFPQGRPGRVVVALSQGPTATELVVEDDGVGFPAFGDAAGVPKSMGLQLAASLAMQLGGELQMSVGCGARSLVRMTRL